MATPVHTPLFAAEHFARYERQQLIRNYQNLTDCNLIVLIDQLFPASLTVVEELLYGFTPNKPIHLLLASPGGNGEAAVRLVRSIQKRCSELTVLLPDMAKSAATILCLGADHLLFGPNGDIGPVDPQLPLPAGLASAKNIVEAVAEAERRVTNNPQTYPLFGGLLGQVNMLTVEQARSALERSSALVEEALASNPRRSPDEVAELAQNLQKPLIDDPKDHSAATSCADAQRFGLPAVEVDSSSAEWQIVRNLWAHYFAMHTYPAGPNAIYEGEIASQFINRERSR